MESFSRYLGGQVIKIMLRKVQDLCIAKKWYALLTYYPIAVNP